METMIAALSLALSMTFAAPAPAGGVHDLDAGMSIPVSDTCFTCGSGSSGSCAKQSGKSRMQCKGSRSGCKSKGCKITGTSSCSSAANVGRC